MAKDVPAVNAPHNHDNIKVDKPAVSAKEPTTPKPMAYDSGLIRASHGLSNETTRYGFNQRQRAHISNLTTPSLIQI